MITKEQLKKHAILFEIRLRSGNVDTILCPVCGIARKVSTRTPIFPSIIDSNVIQANFFRTVGCCQACVNYSDIYDNCNTSSANKTLLSIINNTHNDYERP